MARRRALVIRCGGGPATVIVSLAPVKVEPHRIPATVLGNAAPRTRFLHPALPTCDLLMFEPVLLNLIVAASVIFALVFTVWVIHLMVDDASIIDMIWGAGFGLVAIGIAIVTQPKTHFNVLLAVLPLVWAVRFTTFITLRNWGHGEDDRYTELRERVAKKGRSWLLFSLYGVYGFQGVAMLFVSLPIIIGMAAPESTRIGPVAVLGVILWLVGFVFEAVGDLQLELFKKRNHDFDGPYADKPVLDQGLWRYSRHPNYFGNACLWWGIGLVACAAPWGWLGLVGPAFMNFALLYLTGKANNERKMTKRPAYREYVQRTSGFFPMPPRQ